MQPTQTTPKKDSQLDIDLNGLSLKELKDLNTKVSKAIATFEDRRKEAALARLEQEARALGFTSLAELTGAPIARKRGVSAAKFANPVNADDTWTGKGRKPRWFIEALAAGKTPDDMMI